MIIGNALTSLKLQYEYEPVVIINGNTLKPDFYISGKNIYIEYYGMRSINSYDQQFRKKKTLYRKLGMKVINLFPKDIKNQKKLRDMLGRKIKRMAK